MEDKILRILKIKIDAINRNIDNLNYLNGELEKNNEDLEYIEEKIGLFDGDNILNFDNISKEDFKKILSMINPSIKEVFKDKTCNYEGIIYIIEGIRKSISLQLTQEQATAIYTFIEGMKEKSLNLRDTISNLLESKNRLPETDLNVLNENLENYQNIVSKFENNLYLTEIDEISEALGFADVMVEEKADIYEFILKYNATIYSLKDNSDFDDSDVSVDITDGESDENAEMPKFDFNSVNVDYNFDNKEENDKFVETNEEAKVENDEEISNDDSFQDIKFNLDNFNFDKKEEDESDVNHDAIQIPITSVDSSEVSVPDIESNKVDDDNRELNTVELDDIIKKIDAKLKQMELDEVGTTLVNNETKEEKNINIEQPIQENITSFEQTEKINTVDIKDILNKFDLDLEVNNSNVYDVEDMLNTLNENKLLDVLKENKNVLTEMLSNNNNNTLTELIELTKENLVAKNDDLNIVLEIVIKTMPILLTNRSAFASFKDNLVFFKEKNINIINLFDNYRELLIMNNSSLKENYNKVSTYGIEINNDNVKYLLYNKHVVSELDSYIEAIGFEKGFLGKEDYFEGLEYIKKNPYKISNVSRDMLMKLRYTSENSGKIYGNKPGILAGEITNPKVDILKLTPEYINSYFDGEYGFIDRSEFISLKEGMDNLDEFDMTTDEYLTKLDNYKVSDLKYKIGSAVISRVKTIRLYNFLKAKVSTHDAMLIALTYNSVIKQDEYDSIESVVNSIVGGN